MDGPIDARTEKSQSPLWNPWGLSVLLTLLVTVLVLNGWRLFDDFQASREIKRYLKNHQQLLSTLQSDGRVYELTLRPVGRVGCTLLISLDVADKQTFERVEEQLNLISQRFNSRFDRLVLRSGEELGNDWGLAAKGIGGVFISIRQLLISSGLAIAIALTSVSIFNRRWAARRSSTAQPIASRNK